MAKKMRQQLLGSVLLAIASLACDEKVSSSVHHGPEAPLTNRELFERRRVCFELGWRVFTQKSAEIKRRIAPTADPFGSFAFNEKNNTCYCYMVYIAQGNESEVIFDTLRNEQVASLSRSLPFQDTLYLQARRKSFEALQSELMGTVPHWSQ